MKQIRYIIAIAAAFLFGPALHAQLDPVMVDKYATPNGDGTWTLTLKSYVTGALNPHATMEPADIIFAMDISGSMKNNIGKDDTYSEVTKPMTATLKAIKETTKAMTATTNDKAVATAKNPTVATKKMTETDRTWTKTQNWTYNGVKYGNADGTAAYSKYYRDSDGNYYVVHRADNLLNSTSGKNNVRALWYVDKNGRTNYLTNSGVSNTYEDITSSTATIWNGTLYTGWTYNTKSSTDSDGNTTTYCYGFHYGNETATVEKQWYYLHEDGEYYPVRRANNLPDSNGGNTARAAWVVINGVTWYLHGEKLDTDYDHDMMSDYRTIYLGPLYKGGWQYSTIKAATVDGGHYYKYGDKYYPVQKAPEEVGGVTTYQAFVEIPGVGKRYLYGTNKLSETPCPFATSNVIYYYFGDLYTGGWNYNITTDGTTGTKHYYLHDDGVYYPVRRETSTNNFQLYVVLPEGKRYFDGNGLSETPYALSTTKYFTVYFGSFYTMTGWSYAGVTAATAGSGHYYKHTDNNYYPVLKEDLGAGLEGRYQLYVEVPEGKRYLWGHQLQRDACPYSAATTTVIWCGTLYKGGWSYSTITVNTSDKQGYSYLHSDGEYYPIFQETVTISGATTYQDYVILPDGNKWYLCGNAVSRNPYPYTLKNTVNNWFGPLYSGAWTYANTTAGNANSGYFYLNEDDREYYAVLKEDNTSGSTRYQLYVNLPEGKRYLYGTGISASKYPFSARTNVGIFYNELYSGGWTYANITAGSNSGGHYYLYEGKYYKLVKEDRGSSAGDARYQVYIGQNKEGEDFPLGKMYLHGNSISADPYPTSATTGASLYFGSVYLLKQYNYTRYEGLRRAVSAFVERMAERSQADGVHTRIALVQYACAQWKYRPNPTSKDYPHLKTIANAESSASFIDESGAASVVLADFQDLATAEGVQALRDALPEGTPTTGWTRAAYGMVLSKGLFLREGGDDSVDYDGNGDIDNYEKAIISGTDKTNYNKRKKILITIGDGEDNKKAEWKEWADDFKANVPDAKVFVVHVQTTAIQDHEKYVASPDEDRDGDGVKEFHYYYDVKYYDETLIEALLGITEEIGGAAIDLGAEAIVQDVVKPEFSVPAGAVIHAYTANCIGGDDTALVFEGEDDWEPFSLTGRMTRKDNADGTTTIRVTGFDFSANWCGNHGTDEGYKGKQLILQIPIIPKEGIVGGEIPTNTKDSQILDGDGKPVAEYPVPYVGPFPMRIEIVKSGLLSGESAVFFIWRKAKDAATFNKTGLPFMKVVLTGTADGTDAEAVIENLDPDYSYLIEESTWSWKYTPSPLSISTDDQSVNPFKFKNTLKDVSTKNGEAKAKNEFF